jgi:hypothetical protein
MFKLDNVTLLSIANYDNVEKTLRAMKHCLSQVNFKQSLLITDSESEHDNTDINIVYNDKKIDIIEYSIICINKLHDIIETDYVLMVQYDGYIIDPSEWTNEFLNYDYIGAPWGFPSDCRNRVGNGGFCLRSKRFLEVSSKIQYVPYNYDVYTELQRIDRPIAPEDWFLCYHSYYNMVRNGIKFSPIDLAYKFSVEHPSELKYYDRELLNTYKSFGFHGELNAAAIKLLEK